MKIFISHSSKDKDFVTKLALDFLGSGLPVWFDTWEIGLGDSLYKKIYSGLENSSYVIVVVSEHFNKSMWTSKEFTSILALEDREGRKIIIPIVIDASPVPIEIADRVYGNFKEGYDKKILDLKRFFSLNNLSIKNVPLQERLIPVVFNEHLYLEKHLLIQALEDRKYPEEILKTQIWIEDVSIINNLSVAIKKDIETRYATDVSIKLQLKDDLRTIEKLVGFLYSGTEIMLNTYSRNANIHLMSQAMDRFYRSILNTIYSILYRYSNLKEVHQIGIEKDSLVQTPFATNGAFRKFYGVEDYWSLVIFDPNNARNNFTFLAGPCYATRQLDKLPIPDSLISYFDHDLVYDYLIPQNVMSHLSNPTTIELMPEFEKYHLGIS